MITIDQWRLKIGTFCHPALKTPTEKDKKHRPHTYNLCARLFITALILWGVYLEHSLINTLTSSDYNYKNHINKDVCHNGSSIMQPLFYQDPYFNNLILAMDIESNPGPTELKEIKENPGENNTKTKVTFHRPFLFSGLKGGVNK